MQDDHHGSYFSPEFVVILRGIDTPDYSGLVYRHFNYASGVLANDDISPLGRSQIEDFAQELRRKKDRMTTPSFEHRQHYVRGGELRDQRFDRCRMNERMIHEE